MTPCAIPSSSSYSGATYVGTPPESTRPSTTLACELRCTTTGAPSGAIASANAWLPWLAPFVRNQVRAAPCASAARVSARWYGVGDGPRSIPWMSAGTSSISAVAPSAVRRPGSAPAPPLCPGTWKRVEPRKA